MAAPVPGRLAGRFVGLGITGSIAAFKAVDLLRLLRAEGAEVQVLMTPSAVRFVAPLTLAAPEPAPRRRGRPGPPSRRADRARRHRRRGRRHPRGPGDGPLAGRDGPRPAGRRRHGHLPRHARAGVVAPAMDGDMYAHPATQANVARLRDGFGYAIVEPEIGRRSPPARSGPGRLADLGRDRRRRRGRDRRPAGPAPRTRPPRPPRPGDAPPGSRRPGRPARRRHGRRDGRADRPGPLHRQPLIGEDGRRRRRGAPATAAPASRSWPARSSVPLPDGVEVVRAETAVGDARPPFARLARGGRTAGRASTRSSWPPRSPTSGRPHAAETKISRTDAGLTLDLVPNPDLARRARPARPRPRRGGRAAAPAAPPAPGPRRVRRRDRSARPRAPRSSGAEARRPPRRQRRGRGRVRLRDGHEPGHAPRRRRGRGRAAAPARSARSPTGSSTAWPPRWTPATRRRRLDARDASRAATRRRRVP